MQSPLKKFYSIAELFGEFLYCFILGFVVLIFLFFFANIAIYLMSYVSERLIDLIDYIFG